ncbi:MAG: RNA polymerase sigma factor FliA [Pseudomonadales bacterium]|nr:RNA polymerase sigma factor FliA [Pseudomonadales bacterium]
MRGHNDYLNVQKGSAESLVLGNAVLVKRLAYHLKNRLPPNVELDDLIQAGMLGLIEAAGSFCVTKGASFETYAGIRIRGAMLDHARKNDWVPRSVPKKMRDVSDGVKRLEQQLGRNATHQEISTFLGMSSDEYHQVLQDTVCSRIFSLDQASTGDEPGEIDVDDAGNPLDQITSVDFQRKLAIQIDGLPEKEKLVMALYYDEELNFKEIAAVMDVSESRICQIHGQALIHIKSRMSTHLN